MSRIAAPARLCAQRVEIKRRLRGVDFLNAAHPWFKAEQVVELKSRVHIRTAFGTFSVEPHVAVMCA